MSKALVCLAVSVVLFPLPALATLTNPGTIVKEAAGPDGAAVFFTIVVVGGNDGSDGRPADTVTCAPASGSLFPIGTTTVSCSGSEGSTGSFDVNVIDSTPPALSLPFDFTVVTTNPGGEAVSYSATASDLVEGSVAIACAPPSGWTFPIGTTAVSCTASDSKGNTTTGGFLLTLATSPPDGNPDIVSEATGPDGARVVFNTGDSDDEDGRPGSGSCSPAPGSTFPLGDTVVTCPSGNFTISVVDTTAPSLALPATISAVATTPAGAAVTYTATASDLVDGNVSVTCTPPSGSTFALGTTTVTCAATDARANTATGSFQVLVTSGPEPPPNAGDVTAEATGPAGAVVTFDPGLDGRGRPITCAPASGSTFPLGETTVSCTSGATFTVTVVDTTPPALTLPADQSVEATSGTGAIATFAASAGDLVDGTVAVACTPPSGSTFVLGTTTVSCSATDAHDNTSAGSFNVTVADTTPPVIVAASASPISIWPPNRKLTAVTVTLDVDDTVDPAPLVRIYDITCDESIAASDAVITGPLTADLRAERDPRGDGRVYTLHLEAIDASGNRSTAAVTVTVPHDQSSSSTITPSRRRRPAGGGR